MMTINKSNVVLVIVVVAAIAVASVVAVHGHSGAAVTSLSASGAENPSAAGLADTSGVASSTGSGLAAVDPAKQDPTLDQFTSRNPFIQATAAPSTGGSTPAPTGTPTASPSATPKPVAANIHIKSGSVNATFSDQKVGAKLPPSSSVFKITAISSTAVTFELLNGYTLGGDTSKKTFAVTQSTSPTQVILVNGSKQSVYLITVLQIVLSGNGSGSKSSGSNSSGSNNSGSGGSGSASDVAGHSIKALSIETHNGVPGATLAVDGTTFAAKKVGDVMTTSWGQIKILGINGPAQTVTILHADVQMTLRVGQSVSK